MIFMTMAEVVITALIAYALYKLVVLRLLHCFHKTISGFPPQSYADKQREFTSNLERKVDEFFSNASPEEIKAVLDEIKSQCKSDTSGTVKPARKPRKG